MKTPLKVPFWLSATILVLAWSYLAFGGWLLPVRWLVSGEVFRRKFDYVLSPDEVGDGFNVGVARMLLVSLIAFCVFVGVAGLLRWFTAELSRVERSILRVLFVLLGLLPLSAIAVAFVMILRLVLEMGATYKRLAGLGCTAGAAVVVLGCLWLFLKLREKPGAEQNVLEATAG
jgi:hypothetical protein